MQFTASPNEMPKVVIENPVLNSPYEEPKRHLYFDEDGITDRVVDSRRISSYFVPIPKPKGKGRSPGKIAIKVINHYGDEVLKVYSVE